MVRSKIIILHKPAIPVSGTIDYCFFNRKVITEAIAIQDEFSTMLLPFLFNYLICEATKFEILQMR